MAASVAGGTIAAQRGATTTIAPASRASTGVPAKLRSQPKMTNRRSTSRGSVNVRKLATHAPKVRPTGHLPFLTHKPAATGSPRPKVLALAPPAPTLATANSGAAAALPSFDGLSDQVANVEPPDPWVAVGPEHIVQAV
ncbi:MAG: hypothetical protein QOE66_1748, partial [Chloroflexota bacterium]|nr:hypothetical protein [Chloroflexota bacterium]